MTPEELKEFEERCESDSPNTLCDIDEWYPESEYELSESKLIDFINNLLQSRQEKIVEELEKSKRYIVVLEDDVLREPKENEETFNQGLDKAIEIIKNNANINLS